MSIGGMAPTSGPKYMTGPTRQVHTPSLLFSPEANNQAKKATLTYGNFDPTCLRKECSLRPAGQ